MAGGLTEADRCDERRRLRAPPALSGLGAAIGGFVHLLLTERFRARPAAGIGRTVFAAMCALLIFQNTGHTQMAADPYAKAYLIDRPPGPADMARLPKSARNVVVAKVRLIERPRYLVGRDQSGAPPPLPPDLFEARFKVVSVLQGTQAAPGTEYVVRFGEPGMDRRHIYPHTPDQVSRDYFVVMYLADNDVRRLLEFPVSEKQFQEWEREVLDLERERSRPGVARP